MRHRVVGKKLSRTTGHRKALLKNLASEIVIHGKIDTTLAKAKYVRPFVEKLITRAKLGGTDENVRFLKSRLGSDEAVRKLVTEVGPSNKKREGGYTKVIKTGNRNGDQAKTARIELVKNK